MKEKVFTIDNKTITLYSNEISDSPIIYLNSNRDIGPLIVESLSQTQKAFNLVTIDGLSWNTDLPPWSIPPVLKGDSGYVGGADSYLKQLTNQIIPEVEGYLSESIRFRGIAGYSLAGLFALYSAYQTDLFSRIACVSGSLWFPDFLSYAETHHFLRRPDRIYLSLGSKEAKVRNPILRTVRENTETLAELYRNDGIDVKFEINPGNHFQNAVERLTKGIDWILES